MGLRMSILLPSWIVEADCASGFHGSKLIRVILVSPPPKICRQFQDEQAASNSRSVPGVEERRLRL
jgi:hypothetical protein